MSASKATKLNPSFHFPQDLIIEILLRLPVISLLRFSTVCKTWRDLIKNPDFISNHMNQSKQNPNSSFDSLLVVSHSCETDEVAMSLCSENGSYMPADLNFPFMAETNYLDVIGVGNGLVCVSLAEFEFDLFICNPSTRKFSRIPYWESWIAGCLSNGEAAFGFTFDPCADDYMFINLTRYIDDDNQLLVLAGVYTMSNNSWREIDIAMPIDNDLRLRNYFASVVINNVLYWEYYMLSSSNPAILSFNTSDESFEVISAPQLLDGMWDDHFWELTQLKEELAVILLVHGSGFLTWVLDEDLVDWNMKFATVIPIPSEVEEVGEYRLVGRGKNNKVIYEYRTSGDVRVFSCDILSGEVKMLSFGEIQIFYQVYGYTESLLPVKRGD